MDAVALAALNRALCAFVRIYPARGTPVVEGPLLGWSIAVKDCFDVAGEIASVGTPLFAGRRATSSATSVRRLELAGARIAGHAQMVEFAFG